MSHVIGEHARKERLPQQLDHIFKVDKVLKETESNEEGKKNR